MAMAEIGQGIGLLPGLILQRIPYDIEIRPMAPSCCRTIGIAVKDRKMMSAAMEKFMKYVRCSLMQEKTE